MKEIYKFMLYVYLTYIKEDDLEILNKLGKFFIYPAWFIRSILVWVMSPLFLPEYFIKQTATYKRIKKIQNSPEYQAMMHEMMKRIGFTQFN